MLNFHSKTSLIAFYLPQYHPIPENDAWWGKGFTEWTNVTKARPLFSGHYQPHLPTDLGFYDLRVPEVREMQAELAKAYGIYGFCYYHYWFHGKRLLERPLDEVLASGKPDFPFCLCWANESWSRNWDGLDREVLIRQEYSEEDNKQHIRWLANVFNDSRYIRINGKPLFLVYRASKVKDALKMTQTWREELPKYGINDIFLCRVESRSDEKEDPTLIGFDASVEFQPDWENLGRPLQTGKHWELARRIGLANSSYKQNRIYNYSDIVQKMLAKPEPSYRQFYCVTPAWDNTPRRKSGAIILKDSTPQLYEHWLKTAIDKTLSKGTEENLVFINAWNEWAEGSHLEPCQKWEKAYLEATLRALWAEH
ncbi:glycoside hydrolase family 99-like domain-containing protein [Leptothermofonsia sichuanensis E412]|uniref:glycoside hydrolase family 99-like domain-containing protein n=1 Tax=Leptothermofonsia sichuanensis TaxID=2917832 RepID=UPI001CA7A99B|nr:glycoside hydrolase family 99-like domain-containing protein [Leptothermofonsia sichuanensis]QZZ20419.1 glycoside hydrolase family 99-like domain-containing protein [Leptothermofonsia sichuanensis E412]